MTSTEGRATNDSGPVGARQAARAAPASLVGSRLARRNVLKGAALGLAGGGLVSAAVASPASATTTIEQGAVAPAVVSLSDGPEIAVDASLGNDFRVTIAASRFLATPTNPTAGQQIVFQVTQGGGGCCVVTWDTAYKFPATLSPPVLSTAPRQTDLLGFRYDASSGSWLLMAFVRGFD